jgi:hypothetical protein
MTVTQLLALCDLKYPNSATSATKVIYMNAAQDILSAEGFGDVVTNETLETIANDDEYALPTGCNDVTQIEYLEIEKESDQIDYVVASTNMKVGAYTIAHQPTEASRISFTVTTVATADTLGTIALVGTSDGATVTETITPLANSRVWSSRVYTAITSITGSSWVTGSTADTIKVGVQTDRYNYTRYMMTKQNEDEVYTHTFRQGYTAAGVKSLIIYPVPTTSGYNIRIRYRRNLTELSADSASASPDFDSNFHAMLAIYAAMEIANNSASPDTIKVNNLAMQYDQYMAGLWRDRLIRENAHPQKRRSNDIWRKM